MGEYMENIQICNGVCLAPLSLDTEKPRRAMAEMELERG